MADERLARLEKIIAELSEICTEQVTAIRQLAMVNASILDAQSHLMTQLKELQEAQKHTDERLNALINTVERVIQRDKN
jgi:hypothetical protein